MYCEGIARKLAARAMDELAPPDRAEVDAHLAACRRCRSEAEEIAASLAGLRALPGLAPSAERRERALEAMRRGAAERLARPAWERLLRALIGRRNRWAAAGLAAAAVLGLAATGVLHVPVRRDPVRLFADRVAGTVELERAGSPTPVPVRPDTALAAGDTLRVRDGARAVLRLSNGGRIECRAGTSLRLEPAPAGTGDVLFTLNYGALWCELNPLPRGHYVIRDPRDRRVTVLGTKFEVVCR
jgi:hypothetical protein